MVNNRRWHVGDYVRCSGGTANMVVVSTTDSYVTAVEVDASGALLTNRVTGMHDDFVSARLIPVKTRAEHVLRMGRSKRTDIVGGHEMTTRPRGLKATLRVHGETVTIERTDDESIGIQTSEREKADGEALYLGLDEARMLAYALLSAIDKDVV